MHVDLRRVRERMREPEIVSRLFDLYAKLTAKDCTK